MFPGITNIVILSVFYFSAPSFYLSVLWVVGMSTVEKTESNVQISAFTIPSYPRVLPLDQARTATAVKPLQHLRGSAAALRRIQGMHDVVVTFLFY